MKVDIKDIAKLKLGKNDILFIEHDKSFDREPLVNFRLHLYDRLGINAVVYREGEIKSIKVITKKQAERIKKNV